MTVLKWKNGLRVSIRINVIVNINHYTHLTAYSRTTWVSWNQEGRIILDFNEA